MPIVSVEVCAAMPLSVTDEGLRLHVAGSLKAVGLIEHVRLTVPENPPDPGATVMVDILPAVAPGTTLMLPPFDSEKVGDAVETMIVNATVLWQPPGAVYIPTKTFDPVVSGMLLICAEPLDI